MKIPALLLCVSLSLPLHAQDEQRPANIVVLFADDAGYADFGFQPNVQADIAQLTPHIDSIATAGARFTNAYMTGCVCSPSRAGLMTGRWQGRFGHENNLRHWIEDGLPISETLLPTRLKALGYRTGLAGKWHLGYPSAFHPNERGFDWFFGCLRGSRSYHPIDDPTPITALQENGEPTPESGYVTDRLGDAACRFIAESRDEPFFLFVSFTAPHGPLEPRKGASAHTQHITDGDRRKYAGLVIALDDNVGKILAALRAAGIADNTLVVFTNDNGGRTQLSANNAPLRGGKGDVYEGGVRVPLAMRWPGRIAAGSVIDDPVSALDFVPTFVTLAGGALNDEWNLDGVDLTARITGAQEQLAQRPFFWRYHGRSGPIAMRAGPWKVVHNRHVPDAQPELYDLTADLAEEHDLASEHSDVLTELLARLVAWEAELAAPLWSDKKR